MGVGLVMSYSRGAWVGTAIGLLYLGRLMENSNGGVFCRQFLLRWW